jgi:hypothetical protein
MIPSTLFLVLWAYWMMAHHGYGFRAFIIGATGRGLECGRDLPDHQALMTLAQEYMLAAYAFPRGISWVALFLVGASLALFLAAAFLLAAHRQLGTVLLSTEVLCVAVLYALRARAVQKEPSRKNVLRSLSMRFGGIGPLRHYLDKIPVNAPTRWLDLVSLKTSWAFLAFYFAAMVGTILYQESLRSLHLADAVFILANLFSLPIFLGFSLVGVFPWPCNTPESTYYPLYVLARDLEKFS